MGSERDSLSNSSLSSSDSQTNKKQKKYRDRDRRDRSHKNREKEIDFDRKCNAKKRSHHSQRDKGGYFTPNPLVRHSDRGRAHRNERDGVFGIGRDILPRFDDEQNNEEFEADIHFDYGLSDAKGVTLDNAQNDECNNQLKQLLAENKKNEASLSPIVAFKNGNDNKTQLYTNMIIPSRRKSNKFV